MFLPEPDCIAAPTPPCAPVPLLAPAQVLAQQPELASAMQARAAEVIASGQYVLGPDVEAFERACAPWLHARHAVGVSNGSDALLLALAALDIGLGDQVLVPTYTFVASAGSVARLGATPRLVDVCPSCLTLAPADAEARINAHTRAVMPVHLFGQLAAMPAVCALARRHRLAVVEDAAQSFGAAAGSIVAPELPHLWATSFFPSKNLGGCGDAGLVATDDPELDAHLRALRVHGSHLRYQHTHLSGNFRIDALQAALLLHKLGFVAEAIAQRRRNAARYAALFAARLGRTQKELEARGPPCTCAATSSGESKRLLQGWQSAPKEKAYVALPHVAARHSNAHHTFNQYVIHCADRGIRDHVVAALTAQRIGCAIYYPTPLHLQPCFAYLGHRQGDFPAAEAAADTSLALPVAEHLDESQQAQVVHAVVKAVGNAALR